MKRVERFFLNGIMMALSAILMRTVGVCFNVYVSNKVGAEVMGLYGLLTSVYTFAITFATSGINLSVTRLVSENLGKENYSAINSALKKCVAYSICFGVTAFLLLFGFAKNIGLNLLGDARTVRSLRVMAITLPFISLASVGNGYFTAVRHVYKNAISQFLEQGAKITACVYLFMFLLPKGTEYACLALALSGVVSEVCSFLLMLLFYLFDKTSKKVSKAKSLDKNEAKKITRRVLHISLPVAFSAYMRSGLVSIEHILIPIGLRKNGASKEYSLAIYGVLGSMALPVVLFPAAMLSAFSALLIPELSECNVMGQKREIRYICERGFQVSSAFSIGVAGIMLCFANELGTAIYSNIDAAKYIGILAPLIPIMYMDTATDAMLKGLGEQVYSMNVNIADALVSVVLVWLLVPQIGIVGYVVTIYVCEIMNSALSITRLLNITNMKVNIYKWIFKPLLCIIGAASFASIVIKSMGIDSCCTLIFLTVIKITLCAVFYIILLFLTSAVDKNDQEWLRKIFSIGKKKYKI